MDGAVFLRRSTLKPSSLVEIHRDDLVPVGCGRRNRGVTEAHHVRAHRRDGRKRHAIGRPLNLEGGLVAGVVRPGEIDLGGASRRGDQIRRRSRNTYQDGGIRGRLAGNVEGDDAVRKHSRCHRFLAVRE